VRRVVVVTGLLFWGWLGLASYILYAGIGRLDGLRFPYWQWLGAAWHFSDMLAFPYSWTEVVHQSFAERTGPALLHHPLPWFSAGGIIGFLVLSGWATYIRRSGGGPQLYGDSQWAEKADYLGAGIRLRSRPSGLQGGTMKTIGLLLTATALLGGCVTKTQVERQQAAVAHQACLAGNPQACADEARLDATIQWEYARQRYDLGYTAAALGSLAVLGAGIAAVAHHPGPPHGPPPVGPHP